MRKKDYSYFILQYAEIVPTIVALLVSIAEANGKCTIRVCLFFLKKVTDTAFCVDKKMFLFASIQAITYAHINRLFVYKKTICSVIVSRSMKTQ